MKAIVVYESYWGNMDLIPQNYSTDFVSFLAKSLGRRFCR